MAISSAEIKLEIQEASFMEDALFGKIQEALSAKDNEVQSILAEKFADLNKDRDALEAKLAGIKMKIDDLVGSMDE